jgi:hypothetical protein
MPAAIPLVNGLAEAVKDRPAPVDDLPAPAAPWTHRFKPSGRPAQYELFNHIWLSHALAGRLVRAGIGRRTRRTGDGSDHDPAWIDLDLQTGEPSALAL